VRVGIGIDAHPFAEGRRLVLGGVVLDERRGLAGHSDGDVLAHAVCDAVLGAAGLGDLGSHFPPGDERWRDASSLGFLAHAVALLASAGLRVASVDATVVCEEPAVAPHREEMARRIAQSLGIPPGAVTVKATTTDGLGFTGRREGVAAVAVALVEPAS
jgi:2-C-methyl-D-erythritol 2,4-cyclodiphosphate synthase